MFVFMWVCVCASIVSIVGAAIMWTSLIHLIHFNATISPRNAVPLCLGLICFLERIRIAWVNDCRRQNVSLVLCHRFRNGRFFLLLFSFHGNDAFVLMLPHLALCANAKSTSSNPHTFAWHTAHPCLCKYLSSIVSREIEQQDVHCSYIFILLNWSNLALWLGAFSHVLCQVYHKRLKVVEFVSFRILYFYFSHCPIAFTVSVCKAIACRWFLYFALFSFFPTWNRSWMQYKCFV